MTRRVFPYKINDNLWILGNDYFHIYLIIGKKTCVLVETGISATVEVLLDQIASLKRKPDYLVVTHPHSDHITGLDYLKSSFPHAAVIVGQGAELFAAHPKAAQSFIMEDKHMLKSMKSRGLCKREEAISSVPMLSGSTVVHDGEEIDLGGLTVCFIEARGHSPGNILVQIPHMSTILVSDSLGNYYQGKGFFPTFFTGYKEYVDTIHALQKSRINNLGLAHHGFFCGQEQIEKTFQKALESTRHVLNYVTHNEKSDEDIAKELFKFYYIDELTVYSSQNILNCCRLLVKRIREFT